MLKNSFMCWIIFTIYFEIFEPKQILVCLSVIQTTDGIELKQDKRKQTKVIAKFVKEIRFYISFFFV